MRSAVLFALALLLALTSQSLASARGHVMVAGEMVICSGGQLVTVLVDATGQPVEPPHICPDCALHALAAVSAPDPVTGHAPSPLRLSLPATARDASSTAPLSPCARGPPSAA
ncbi:hypothetical protein [Histidinibacterium lentulum]|uniref:DUF2946 domain-containing protein n=1 Tax=Histidinibacterium lentulum TaxID=2480588 RepID=A0A3N2R0U5_9RHOB|nr:hypothetical protein [Histidinibacterium lentulum]ROU01095.1 hypothetical protein EAT49_11250 [Histidinibacterium lentulum]